MAQDCRPMSGPRFLSGAAFGLRRATLSVYHLILLLVSLWEETSQRQPLVQTLHSELLFIEFPNEWGQKQLESFKGTPDLRKWHPCSSAWLVRLGFWQSLGTHGSSFPWHNWDTFLFYFVALIGISDIWPLDLLIQGPRSPLGHKAADLCPSHSSLDLWCPGPDVLLQRSWWVDQLLSTPEYRDHKKRRRPLRALHGHK